MEYLQTLIAFLRTRFVVIIHILTLPGSDEGVTMHLMMIYYYSGRATQIVDILELLDKDNWQPDLSKSTT